MEEEREITTVRTKGQIVISQKIRQELQIKPNTKLAVYEKIDKIAVAKIAIPPLSEELRGPSREIGEQDKGKKKSTSKQRVKKRARKVA